MPPVDYRIGVLLSAGGSAFVRAVQLSGLDPASFFVITDRECGAENACALNRIEYRRIQNADRSAASERAAEAFNKAGCRLALLHYDRLVSSHLFDSILTVNAHPSLLPAYRGINCIGQAYNDKSLYQGATLHIVDDTIDGGTPIVQTSHPVPLGASLEWRNKLGYIQTSLITLFLFDMAAHGRIDFDRKDISAFDLTGLAPGDFSNPGFPGAGSTAAARKLFAELPAHADWIG